MNSQRRGRGGRRGPRRNAFFAEEASLLVSVDRELSPTLGLGAPFPAALSLRPSALSASSALKILR